MDDTMNPLLREWLKHEQNRRMARPSPDQIFDLARQNVIVAGVIQHWKCGEVTWEQALILMVTMLAAQSRELLMMATQQARVPPFANTIELFNTLKEFRARDFIRGPGPTECTSPSGSDPDDSTPPIIRMADPRM
jgi:hypothetical protein